MQDWPPADPEDGSCSHDLGLQSAQLSDQAEVLAGEFVSQAAMTRGTVVTQVTDSPVLIQ